MTRVTKIYLAAIIGMGAAALGVAASQWQSSDPRALALFLLFSAVLSPAKLRLPKLEGSFSLNFLPMLAGIAHFSLSETVAAACVGTLAASLVNRHKRPTLVQVLFNTANVVLSASACFFTARYLLATAGGQPGVLAPIVLCLVAVLYFFLTTTLVSGILSLLQDKPLSEVTEQWYHWMFPYYMIGAALVSLVHRGDSFTSQSWLILVPLLQLVHFLWGLNGNRVKGSAGEDDEDTLPFGARVYVWCVIAAGFAGSVFAGLYVSEVDWLRLAGYTVVAAIAGGCKVRLPYLTGTLSFGFVPVLVATLEFNFTEATVLSGVMAAVQVMWHAKRQPAPVQIAFNVACMIAATGIVFVVCRLWFPMAAETLAGVAAATLLLYLANSLMVAGVLSLLGSKGLFSIWRECYFWSLPYYSLGAGVVALMAFTIHQAGWVSSLMVLPLMSMLYVCYKAHVNAVREPAEAVAS